LVATGSMCSLHVIFLSKTTPRYFTLVMKGIFSPFNVRRDSGGLLNPSYHYRQYSSASFLDISQAFDKVWHTGLLYKLRRSLPLNYFLILKSYLHSRHFPVKVETEYQCRRTPRWCPRVVIIPATHCRPANLTRIYHSNLCWRYCMDSDPAIVS
jgi:hypothetical protein